MLEYLLLAVHVFVACFMILVVLVQSGNAGGVGAAFGGGNSSGVFGATGAQSLLGKLTYFAAGIFMVTSITLTVMQGHGGDIGLKEKLKQAGDQSGAPQTAPAGEAPVANPTAPAAQAPAPATPAPAPTK